MSQCLAVARHRDAPFRTVSPLVGDPDAGRRTDRPAARRQDELNGIAPALRRGEVTAAFITCIYALVGVSVIATGLLDLRFSLTMSVGGVAAVLGALAVAAGLWQLRAARGLANHRYGA
jgi:hypothetical protein